MGFKIRSLSLVNLFLVLSHFHLGLSFALNTITSGHFIRDHETVSSNSSDFKLGFFSPQNSTNRYVGIWYLSESNIIWVANRNQPVVDAFGTVTISKDGNLVVLDKQNISVWSSNVSNIATNSIAKLLNTGNLVLSDNSTGETIWESFQDPSNLLVPKMKLSINKRTGEKVKLTSWKSLSDPSIGNYSASIERPDAPDVFLWFNGTRPYARTGPWNGKIFIGSPTMSTGYLYGWSVGEEDGGTIYVTFNSANDTTFAVLGLNPQGQLWTVWWNNKKEVLRKVINGTYCDLYGICGAFGSCNSQSSPICSCLNGYVPKNLEEWNTQNWTSGCVRKKPFQCEGIANRSEMEEKDGFVRLENMKVPDFLERSTATEDNCRTQCLDNCCVAYAYDSNGIGCMHWSGDLIDIQRFSSGGVDLYIRVPLSELEKHSQKRTIIIAVAVTIGIITLTACAYLLWKLLTVNKYAGGIDSHNQSQRMIRQDEVNMDELPLFDFEELLNATNNFHSSNMLGRGGFGSVYKGQLKDGQQIAIKRLSKASRQGQEEFMNEVVVISKLQHRNLVRLLGCCIQQTERILIYEYMHNKSLDAILFDSIKKKELDWQKRFTIIEGISRGLLYLHRDSRIKIIHRDLKASNILLDEELNPKISDFGIARIFRSNEEQANTRRVAGTYGYISPEYAMQGQFSEKSDVFSFGVLMLEIVSGRSNSRLNNVEGSQTLLGYVSIFCTYYCCRYKLSSFMHGFFLYFQVWKLWKEDNLVSFIDLEMQHQGSCEDILRCVHIGLLCVQELVKERPTMANVVSMLSSEIANLPLPRQPAYILNETGFNFEPASEAQSSHSANFVSITSITGR
ncbi:G-type lectin S-receptor-like serine/threonine-protein kinase At1g11300 isoform X2 [Prosopis cineraria]|uniref:G-type lectin S-receptor-like serine/threonine-protein kinase At1g11300 isoform X2 n=1 Tax=Prosopis cineraria TaxID=364024 RepID=UPI002410B4E8|nr:G-type lectin S-receptor-like serine/threonine-protein kinase At1g11300 isoform X2 [Prosopis cineraria]